MFKKVSVIIPCYNSEKTIRKSLDSVFAIESPLPYEVIVIDDCSTDTTAAIARSYNLTLISLRENHGPAYARNRGVEKASGDLLFFVDADVVLPKRALNQILKNFNEHEVDCVVGLFAAENPFNNFPSQYKSLYCNFKYQDLHGSTALNTAIAGMKRNVFEALSGFDERMLAVEDLEFADRLFKKGFKTCVDKEIEVFHLKEFTFKSLIKNDFKKSVGLGEIFFRNFKKKDILVKKEFTDFSIMTVMNIPFVYLALLSFLIYLLEGSAFIFSFALIWILIYLINNMKYWTYIKKRKNNYFLLASIAFTFLDYFIVGLAVINSFIKIYSSKQKVDYWNGN